MADHPLRSATHRRLGRPLPHQPANAPQAHLQATDCSVFPDSVMRPIRVSGISIRFRMLSQSYRQVTYVLLTRPPLTLPRRAKSARLACIRHAASVRPEPGSNSPIKLHHYRGNNGFLFSSLNSSICLADEICISVLLTAFAVDFFSRCSVFKEQSFLSCQPYLSLAT